MAYIVITDFKAGLDARKSILTAPPGSLQKIDNAHITRGGEIEKRKAFAAAYSLPAGNTFGLIGSGGQLYTFGSVASPGTMPPGVNYKQLAHPTSSAMTRLIYAENVSGKIYAIAQFADGSVFHYFDGARVTDWDAVSTSASGNSAIAARLAALVDADPAYVASSAGAVATITAQVPGVPFTISSAALNGGSTNDQTLTVATVQANVSAVAGVAAAASFRVFSGGNGTGNSISSVKLGSTEILGTTVPFNGTAAQTALDVASAINATGNPIGWSASASGQTVNIQSLTQSAGQNGLVLSVTANGNVIVDSLVNVAGGVTPVAPVAQICTATVGGTFEAADKFTLTIDGKAFVTTGGAPGMGLTAKTFKGKVYSTAQSLLQFSAVNTPTQWGTAQTPQPGAGNVNMSNQDAGSEALTALGIYQSQLAIFSRRNTQIWTVDADPAKYAQAQNIPNIGTQAPLSVISFGDLDLFFLSDTGIRSLRVRNASNAASVSDVGTAVDPIVTAAVAGLPEFVVQQAVGVIEPVEGRYLLALGGTVFVFSYFPGSQISAWSTYTPGFTISAFAVIGTRLYARSGDTIYLYGGVDGKTYDSSTVEAVLPYHDCGKPATLKGMTGLDTGAEGLWDVYLGTDVTQPDTRSLCGTVGKTTYGMERFSVSGAGSHFGLRMVSRGAGYARISNVTVHFDEYEAG